MSEAQLIASNVKILPELNAESGLYEDKWPYDPWKKPRSLKLCCGLCNTDTLFNRRDQYEIHKKGKGHQAHFERWKTDEIEKQDLRDKNKKLEKEILRMKKKNRKMNAQYARKDREMAELREANAQLELELDDTLSESEDDFEDAEED